MPAKYNELAQRYALLDAWAIARRLLNLLAFPDLRTTDPAMAYALVPGAARNVYFPLRQ